MKMRTFIAIFFSFLIAFQVVHGTIPHDHHTDSLITHQDGNCSTVCHENDCPAKCQETESYADSHQFPGYHCHAFNGFHFVQARINLNLLPDISDTGIICNLPDDRSLITEQFQQYIERRDQNFRKLPITKELFTLRGPPVKA